MKITLIISLITIKNINKSFIYRMVLMAHMDICMCNPSGKPGGQFKIELALQQATRSGQSIFAAENRHHFAIEADDSSVHGTPSSPCIPSKPAPFAAGVSSSFSPRIIAHARTRGHRLRLLPRRNGSSEGTRIGFGFPELRAHFRHRPKIPTSVTAT